MKSNPRTSKKPLGQSGMLVSSKLISSQSKTAAPSDSNLGRRESRFVGGDTIDGDQEDSWLHSKVMLKPPDQLELSEQELKEEHTRMLTANNPRAPSNPTRFIFKESAFKQVTQVDNVAVLFQMDTNLMHKDSDEAKRQIERGGKSSTPSTDVDVGTSTDADNAGVGEAGGPKIMNQFNYSERAAQTLNQPPRERGTMTEPPPRLNFNGSVSQWEIHDAYVEDIRQQQLNKEKSKVSTKFHVKEEPKKRGMSTMDEIESDELQKVSGGLSILERMVNQNTYDDISQDFKYWEDAGDEFRSGHGSLLPLWKLCYDKARKYSVTTIKWNFRYKDFLTVGYGSHSFMNDKGGLLCFFTLKNPSYPEYIFSTESGVASLDNNPNDYNLVAVGLYSGNVAVFDLSRSKEENPIYFSTALTGKHSDPVWQVAWQKPDPDDYLNFYSISSDGVIKVWTLMKNEMQPSEVIKLRVEGQRLVGPSGVESELLGCGTCFDFCKKLDYIFLVGTEEGRVHKCSKTYINQYLDTVQAHNMTLYSLRLNPIHPTIFLTCSADWTVKIWNYAELEVGALFTFDLNSPVADADWAPYASTVFAACTVDGFVFVYDLNINKYAPLCKQQILQGKKGKLTRLVFNPFYPVLIVADDRGTLYSFKLSPNLRKVEMEKGRNEETEIAKMDKLIYFILEPLMVKQRENPIQS